MEEGKNKEITEELKGFYPKSLSSYQDQACICVYSSKKQQQQIRSIGLTVIKIREQTPQQLTDMFFT